MKTRTKHSERGTVERPFERRILCTLDQCRRFGKMAALLDAREKKQRAEILRRRLLGDEPSIEERERVMVILAMKASDEAGEILDEYQPSDVGEEHRLFHQVARIEWSERNKRRRRRKRKRAA